MTTLIQHLTDPQQPAPDITHYEMLRVFTLEIISEERHYPALKHWYTEHSDDRGGVGIVLISEIRTLLFRDISRNHLNRLMSLVFDEGLVSIEALRAAFDGSIHSAVVEGYL